MKDYKRFLALTLSCVLSLSIAYFYPLNACADKSYDTSGLEIGQTTVLYNSSIGMPTSEANAVVQTGDGFIWIGSYSGLVRYDGNQFYRFDSTTGITSVISMYVDSKDRLWIGTNDNGVALFENGTFTFIQESDGLPSSTVHSISETDDGQILVGTSLGLVKVDSKMQLSSYGHKELDSAYIYSMKRGPKNDVYGLTYNGDIFTISNNEVTSFYASGELEFDGYAYCIHPDPNQPGYAYVGTNGNHIYHGDMLHGFSDMTTYEVTEQNSINALYVKGNTLWIGALDGIGYIDLSTNDYKKLQDSKMNYSVENIMEDYEGNLWFASSREGVLKLTTSIFTDINRLNDMKDTVCNTTCLRGDNLYVGTDDGLLVMDKEYAFMETPLTKMLEGIRIRAIKKDSNGNLWICTYSDYGLVCLHPDDTFESYSTETGLYSNRVRTVYELQNGIIAVALTGGIDFIKDDKIYSSFTGDNGISNMDALTICEANDASEVYLGTDGDGLYILPANENPDDVIHFDLDDGLTSKVILQIKYDKFRDYYWIITSNSIAYMKDHEITTITNFPYANNFDIFFDTNNNVWVLSSNGIYVVNADELLENPKTLVYTLYNADSGMPHVTTANSRNDLEENGDLYIAGTTGVTKVNIYNEIKNQDAHLQIPFIEVDDEIYYIDDSGIITIPATAKRVTIYSYALSYKLDNPKLEYYLEGFDENAFTTTKHDLTEVTYTNLKGGTYVYHLKTAAKDPNDEQEITLTIKKQKGLHEYLWFNILLMFFIAGVIFLLIYRRFKKKAKILEEKNKETRNLVTQITKAFAKTIDMKDRYTNGHSFRVARYTKLLARKLGYSEDQVEDMYNIALLHDIGKLSIPDAILNKPEGLNDEEYAVMKSHTIKGEEVLKEISIAPDLAIGAGYHHERLDGKGYPHGYSAEEIPMVAQIIAVADTFDAMYSTRPYRKQLPIQTVLDELKRVSGTQVNAEVVEKLIELADEGVIK